MDRVTFKTYFDRDFLAGDVIPKSLFCLSLDCLIKDISIIAEQKQKGGLWNLKPDIIFPAEICEKFLEKYQEHYVIDDAFVNIFYDTTRTKLRCLKLKNARISLMGFSWLIEHNPKKIELQKDCLYVLPLAFYLMSEKIVNLEQLYLPSSELAGNYILDVPSVSDPLALDVPKIAFSTLAMNNTIQHLDISETNIKYRLDETNNCLPNLKTLILYKVKNIFHIMNWICNRKKLIYLDISCTTNVYGNPSVVLDTLVGSLPDLTMLDISGTNLADSSIVADTTISNDHSIGTDRRTDIPGLRSRVDRPLEFLGLYGTPNFACRRHDIPAVVISGDKNEQQILTAAIIYMYRVDLLVKVLNDLFYTYCIEGNHCIGLSVNIILQAMKTHIGDKNIQILASATLFYIVKGKEKLRVTYKYGKQIISTLLDSMESHMNDETMLRNGYLILCQFDVPTDLTFVYIRIATLILKGTIDITQEGLIQRISMYLLNYLACQVDHKQKEFLGDIGIFPKILQVIEKRLKNRICDDVHETAWSTLWNVTDEAPINCTRFLESNGLDLFLQCLEAFPQNEDLLRNMMGLLGNIAEVKHLRPQLMKSEVITQFNNLLFVCNGIEVSYHAAAVLSHLASDGPQAWTVETPSREEVLVRMTVAISSWDITTERNINYCSFKPILNLLDVNHTHECQYWAVWALANLTTVYPEKYRRLIAVEGGIRKLMNVSETSRNYVVRSLACVLLKKFGL